jgi:hypothetical protein
VDDDDEALGETVDGTRHVRMCLRPGWRRIRSMVFAW